MPRRRRSSRRPPRRGCAPAYAHLVAAGNVSERVREKGLSDADGTDDGHVAVRLDEAHRDELVEQLLVVLDLRRRIPSFEVHAGSELRALRACRRGGAIATLTLVGEQEEEEVLMRHLLLAREGDALGERVEQLAEC